MVVRSLGAVFFFSVAFFLFVETDVCGFGFKTALSVWID